MPSRPSERSIAGAVLALAFALLSAAPAIGTDSPHRTAPPSLAKQAPASAQVPTSEQDSPSELDILLERMSRVARLYTDEALRFSCLEKIRFRSFHIDRRVTQARTYEFDYIYVFDSAAVEDGQDGTVGLLDYRTTRSAEGKEEGSEEVRLEDLELPNYLLRAYSWAFLFQESLWSSYDYRIMGHEEVMGRDATIVAFEALPPFRRNLNDWHGTAWIDSETYQLLRVEALPTDHVEEEARAREAMGSGGIERPRYEYVTFTTEFGEETHGMRFPSKVSMAGTLVEWRSNTRNWASGSYREYKGFQVDQIYSDYSFFSVRTESEIRAYVLAGVQIKG